MHALRAHKCRGSAATALFMESTRVGPPAARSGPALGRSLAVGVPLLVVRLGALGPVGGAVQVLLGHCRGYA